MSAITLHYVYDPLCGWCYGAAPLIAAARERVPVRAHAGGMMAGPGRRAVSPSLRAFVMPHDQRIAHVTGQTFGDAYFERLLRDTTAVFDSEPPIAAVLAAERLAGRGLDLLARLQVAHYVEGQRIADRPVLVELAGAIGLDAERFSAAWDDALGQATQQHIVGTRALMARAGIQGFPGMLLERGGVMTVIDVGRYLGRMQDWVDWLQQHGAAVPARPVTAGGVGCSADACAGVQAPPAA